MLVGWIVAGAVVLGLVGVFVFALMKSASNAERAVRRARWDQGQFLDLTVTTSARGSE